MSAIEKLNLLCWEGYDHPALIDQLRTRSVIDLNTQSIVSDHAAAQRVIHETSNIDVLNINNPYPRKILYPQNKVRALEPEKLDDTAFGSAPWMQPLLDWSYADDGNQIGICQRFGSFNLVINNQKVSRPEATNAGFNLPEETDYKQPYGILQFPEFNIFHICIAAGLNPFELLTTEQLNVFSEKAESWFTHAAMVTEDSVALNRALAAGDISFYLSGGVFVAGAARLEGHDQIECVTPASGPIDGKGAIAFVEINSLVRNQSNPDAGYRFLNQILQPESIVHIATNPQVCNPVIQMQDKRVFDRLSTKYLKAIQWETLEEDIGRCAIYDIPPMFQALSEHLVQASARRNI